MSNVRRVSREEGPLAGYDAYLEERYERVQRHGEKGRVARLLIRLANSSIKDDIETVAAIESVPAAKLSAAQNEGYHVIPRT